MDNYNTWQLLENYPTKGGDIPMIICDDVGYSYTEFYSRCIRTAEFLKEAGVRKGTHVGVSLPSAHLFLEFYMAISRLGAVIVPIKAPSNDEDLTYCIKAAGVTELILGEDLYNTIHDAQSIMDDLVICIVIDSSTSGSKYEQILSSLDEYSLLEEQVDRDDVNMIVFTSGTTAKPKPVFFTYGEIMRQLNEYGRSFANTPEERATLICMPFTHINAWSQFFTGLKNNRLLVTISRFSPDTFFDVVARYKVITAYITPPMLLLLLNDPAKISYANLTSLKDLLFGYDFTPLGIKEAAARAFPSNVRMREVYGLTEAYFRVTTHILNGEVDQEDPTGALRRLESVGKASPPWRVVITDCDGNTLQPNQAGNIKAINTRSGKVIETNDRGYLDTEGYLHFLGYNIAKSNPWEKASGTTIQRIFPLHTGVGQKIGSFMQAGQEGISIDHAVMLASFHEAENTRDLITRYLNAIGEMIPATYYGFSSTTEQSFVNLYSENLIDNFKGSFSAKWQNNRLKESPLVVSSKPLVSGLKRDSEFSTFRSVNAFMAENKPDYAASIPIVNSQGVTLGSLYFFRYGSSPDFSLREQALMRLVGYNIAIALKIIAEREKSAKTLNMVSRSQSFAMLSYLVMDREGNIIYESERSRRGRELLDQGAFGEYITALRNNISELLNSGAKEYVSKYILHWNNTQQSFSFRSCIDDNSGNIITFVSNMAANPSLDHFSNILTKREIEISELLINGYNAQRIADELCISENTAKVHVQHIYHKFGVRSRGELMAILMKPAEK